MMRWVAVVALVFLVGVPGVQAGAEDPTPDHYTTNFANIIGIIGAGGADWFFSYPTDVPTTGTYHLAVSVSTTAAATASLAVAAGSFQGSGCTVGTFTADTAATSIASGYLPITTTGPYCFGSVRFTLSASSTTITAVRATFQIASDTVSISSWPSLGISSWPSLAVSSWPTLNVAQSGAWTITDDANGWTMHQDPVSGTLNVVNSGQQTIKVCGQTGTCGRIAVDANSTISIGTASVNQTVQQELNLRFRGDIHDPGLEWFMSLAFWLMVFVGGCMMGWRLVVGFSIVWFPWLFDSAWPFGLSWALPLLFISLLLEWAGNKFILEKDDATGRYRVKRKDKEKST